MFYDKGGKVNQEEQKNYLAALEALEDCAKANEALSEKLLELIEGLESNQRSLGLKLARLRKEAELK